MNNWVLTYKYPDGETADRAYDRVDEVIRGLRASGRYTGNLSLEHVGFDEEHDEPINVSHFLVLIGDGDLPSEVKEPVDQTCSDGEPKLVTGGDVLEQIVYKHNRRAGRSARPGMS